MAKLSEAQTKLLTHATQPGGIYTGMYRPTINALIKKGYLVETSRNQFEATPAGLAYLYQDEPMVDQPQPPSEVETRYLPAYVPSVGDVIIALDYPEYGNGTILEVYTDGAFVALVEWDNAPKAMITRATKIELTNDDLPFSDLGAEDTQELPIVVVAPAMSLSQLVDAALDPDNQDAFETLKVYDLTNVPLWILEIERNDLADLKWALWSECRKINAGTLMSNPDFVAKQIEVNRAFQVCDILHKEVVNRKAVGFNVLE